MRRPEVPTRGRRTTTCRMGHVSALSRPSFSSGTRSSSATVQRLSYPMRRPFVRKHEGVAIDVSHYERLRIALRWPRRRARSVVGRSDESSGRRLRHGGPPRPTTRDCHLRPPLPRKPRCSRRRRRGPPCRPLAPTPAREPLRNQLPRPRSTPAADRLRGHPRGPGHDNVAPRTLRAAILASLLGAVHPADHVNPQGWME